MMYIQVKKENAMTDLSMEILEKYQVRKSKAQKAQFQKMILAYAAERGYKARVEKRGKAENIVIGNPVSAKVIYAAHYDTPAVMPFPNLMIAKNRFIFTLYQLAVCILLYTVPLLIMFLGSSIAYRYTGSELVKAAVALFGYSLIFVVSLLILAGPANRHNANDNTSGVLALIEIMHLLPPEQKEGVALLFFDLEELGCIGSREFYTAHKNALKSTPVINFDCIGDGSTIFLAPRKGAKHLKEKLEEAFEPSADFSTEVALKSTFTNSDHRNFPLGVGVAAFKTSKHGILYGDRIHTNRDTVCDEKNVDFVARCAVKLGEMI